MPVPWNISLYRIKAGLLYLLETVTPQFFETTEIVKSGTIDEYILTVNGHTRTVITNTVWI